MINNLFSLVNKLSLVTGAGGYLGNMITLSLAEQGSSIILVDNSGKEKILNEKVQELKKNLKIKIFLASHVTFQKLKIEKI